MAGPSPISFIILVAKDPGDPSAIAQVIDQALRDRPDAEILFALSDRARRTITDLERRRLSEPRVRSLVLSHWFDGAAAVQRALPLVSGAHIVTLLLESGADDLAASDDLLQALAAADIAVLGAPVAQGPRGWLAGCLDRRVRTWFGADFASVTSHLRAHRRAVLTQIADRSVSFDLLPLLAAWRGHTVAVVRDGRAARPLAAVPAAVRRTVATAFLYLLLSFTTRPVQLFGAVGALAMALGLALTLPLIGARLLHGEGLADEPALLPGLLFCALGVQCAAIGLVAELLVFARNREIEDDRSERLL